MLKLPSSSLVNRKIPKSKFYEKLQANTQLKEIFTNQVESIVWKYKLSKETIHLEPKDEVEEIQVFEITLRQKNYSIDLLRSIDRAIPYPILFLLLYGNQVKLAIAYKERNQNDENRTVIHSYHETEWQQSEEFHFDLLNGLNLKAVYEHMIRSLLSIQMKPEIDFSEAMQLQEQINKLQAECKRLEAKIRTEKQFNRKVELNMELQRKQRELEMLLKL